MTDLEELTYAACRGLLAGRVFGRVGVCTPDGPRILPVNYGVVDEAIVFRTTSDGVVGTHGPHRTLAFEVDDADPVDQTGWSVLAVGPGERIDDPGALGLVKRTWDPRPWAGGPRPLYVRLRWVELTGRRVGPGRPGDHGLASHRRPGGT